MRGNPDNLRRAAARKSAAAQARAEQGLREMIRRNEPIIFRGLAQTAGVSLDFLYRYTPIRQRVEQLRTQQQNTPPPAAATPTRKPRAASYAPSPPSSPNSNGVTVTSRRAETSARGRTRREPRTTTPPRLPTSPRRHHDTLTLPLADAYANDLPAQTHKFKIITPDKMSA